MCLYICMCVLKPFTGRTSEAYVGSVLMREHVNATVLAKRERWTELGIRRNEKERAKDISSSRISETRTRVLPEMRSSSSEVLVFASG